MAILPSECVLIWKVPNLSLEKDPLIASLLLAINILKFRTWEALLKNRFRLNPSLEFPNLELAAGHSQVFGRKESKNCLKLIDWKVMIITQTAAKLHNLIIYKVVYIFIPMEGRAITEKGGACICNLCESKASNPWNDSAHDSHDNAISKGPPNKRRSLGYTEHGSGAPV